jgi:hypothetical protein
MWTHRRRALALAFWTLPLFLSACSGTAASGAKAPSVSPGRDIAVSACSEISNDGKVTDIPQVTIRQHRAAALMAQAAQANAAFSNAASDFKDYSITWDEINRILSSQKAIQENIEQGSGAQEDLDRVEALRAAIKQECAALSVALNHY